MRYLSVVLTALAAFALTPGSASANECELTISGNDAMKFDKTELSVPASCEEVTVKLEHSGKMAANVMGHNWVLSKESDKNAITGAAVAAGMDNEYVPDDDKVIAHTDVIGGGESTEVTFSTSDLSADEEYVFFCSFPGHWNAMVGTFKIES